MNRAAFGVFALMLLAGAFVTGVIAIGLSSPLYAATYLAVAALLSGAVIAIFFTKCPMRGKGCVHFLPGRIAALLPARQEKYTAVDIAAVSAGILLIVAVPQYWLFSQVRLFALFWVLGGTGLFLINRRVCPGCGNACCPVRPKG